jgi:Putative DNA-binding domain
MATIDLETFDLSQLPSAEDDDFEFKSSLTSFEGLKDKLQRAASGFANSGGGFFIAGVDEKGYADGGFLLKVGKEGRRSGEDLRDWVDTIVNSVEPAPKYEIKLINNSEEKGIINSDCAVLILYIYESFIGPHMAPDKRYYIRAGAHTVPAKHFIVDAIWAKRHVSKPRLTHLFRLKPEKESVVQLGVLTLTDSPAVNVTITISPLPNSMNSVESLFPLKIPVVDRNNPFFFDVQSFCEGTDSFKENTSICVGYDDLAGNHYIYKTLLKIDGALPPMTIGNDNPAKLVKVLESIEKTISNLKSSQKSVVKASILFPKQSEEVFSKLEKLIPELLAEIRSDLRNNPFMREFIILSERWMYNSDPNNKILHYFFEKHSCLRNKLRILENYGLVCEITYNDVPRFVISEELANHLTSDVVD